MSEDVVREQFAPCPVCHQYSHSIGEDQLAEAFRHFQSMYSHRGDGIPTQHSFDEKTRDAAQVLMAAARSRPTAQSESESMVEAVAVAIERADNESNRIPEGTIRHPEVSSWGEHLARAALSAMPAREDQPIPLPAREGWRPIEEAQARDIEMQLKAVGAKAAETLWMGSSLLKGLALLIRRALPVLPNPASASNEEG